MKSIADVRRGRPPEFRDRVRLQVFLERRELASMQRVARAAGLSASRWARQALLGLVAPAKGARHAR